MFEELYLTVRWKKFLGLFKNHHSLKIFSSDFNDRISEIREDLTSFKIFLNKNNEDVEKFLMYIVQEYKKKFVCDGSSEVFCFIDDVFPYEKTLECLFDYDSAIIMILKGNKSSMTIRDLSMTLNQFRGNNNYWFPPNSQRQVSSPPMASDFGELPHPQSQEIVLDGFDEIISQILDSRHDGDRRTYLTTALNRKRIFMDLPIISQENHLPLCYENTVSSHLSDYEDIIIRMRKPASNQQIKQCLLDAFERQEDLFQAIKDKEEFDKTKQHYKGKTKTKFVDI